ncbi:hypothetical protein FRC09_005065 [Ceratobasidium sp. 395]|nr:hypothetical protein FRC09_005065 [Ceratobasidium sp. 395]
MTYSHSEGFLQTTIQSRDDYCELASNITLEVKMLEGHLSQPTPPQMTESVTNVINELRIQAEYINAKQRRSGFNMLLEAEADIEEILKCYRRIDALFRRLQGDVILNVWKVANDNFTLANEHLNNTRLAELDPSKKARYDSNAASQVRRGGCTPNTRQLVLQEIEYWANDPHGSKLYWMNGMAGTGKTTIAYSLCSQLEASHQLAASFFCSRSLPDCRDVSRIIPTIAYQLARLCRPFQNALCQALRNDPDIGTRGILAQFENLLDKPLQKIKDTLPTGLLVIVIDALDECSDLNDAHVVLDILLRSRADLPVKFFVTCRPDGNVLAKLSPGSHTPHCLYHLHNIEESLVQSDIETYLNDELLSIGATENQIQSLAKRSGRLFIYAATAVRYVKANLARAIGSQKRLSIVLGLASVATHKLYEPLDTLYSAILSAALDNEEIEPWEKKNIEVVLHTVVCAKEPLSTHALVRLLGLKSINQVQEAIEPLRSVLHMDEGTGLVSTLHASFPDYMQTVERSGQFSCDTTAHNGFLALRCFETMKSLLCFNICNLESSLLLDKDVFDISNRVIESIPSHLYYACQYWSDHLVLALVTNTILDALDHFLRHQVLFWIEVLNLKGSTSVGVLMLSQTNKLIKETGVLRHLYALFQDAQKFLTIVGASPVRTSTPHIYVSVLALWDRRGPMWVQYGAQMQGLVVAQGTAIESRDPSALAVWRVGREVFSVAVSPDGKRIASAARDCTIHIWDAHNGDIVVGPLKGHTAGVGSVAFSPSSDYLVSGSDDQKILVWDVQSGRIMTGPFQGHTGWVRSVVYAPDGEQIASGASDCTLRIWNVRTGQTAIGPLRGHSAGICSVAYSPDGNRVISGSADSTIRVWDARSGHQITGPFRGHTGHVLSAVYSPDGSRIASGASDRTIQVWDSETGNCLGVFKGHELGVRSVAYSPDGNRIASSSFDRNIRVWDALTGRTVAGPFRAHTEWVYSVVFTPDGDRIVSGAGDATIRIWDAQTKHIPSELFEGHRDHVLSVAFFPDSRKIVSGSDDNTLCVWDARTGYKLAGPFRGHTGAIHSVSVSCDGNVVSGSADNTIRIWNMQTRSLHAVLEGHTDDVYSLACSPDGKYIASGSKDRTIRIWDMLTKQTVIGPLQGHSWTVRSVSYSHDGLRIASGSNDYTIRIWDTKTGSMLVGPFKGHTDMISSIAYSPNGSHLVSGSHDQTIRVWDAQTGQMLFCISEGFPTVVGSVAFSPDGNRIVSGSGDRTIRIWDSQSGHASTGSLGGHTTRVHSVACSPDGSLIASGSNDGAIRVWDSQIYGPTDHWTVNKAGWVVDRDASLLLWVPQDLRTGLKWPQNVAVIHRRGNFQLDFTNALIGSQWRECYRPL